MRRDPVFGRYLPCLSRFVSQEGGLALWKNIPFPPVRKWSFELIEAYDRAIAEVAKEYRLDTYPNQIEIISSEQMMDAYASVGMPLGYSHWSYGKQF